MNQAVIEQFNKAAQAADPIGATIKFVVDDTIVFIDGNGEENKVSSEDNEADCTISTSLEHMMALRSGDLNPMMAVMSGKVKIKGDMGVAMKIQSLLS